MKAEGWLHGVVCNSTGSFSRQGFAKPFNARMLNVGADAK